MQDFETVAALVLSFAIPVVAIIGGISLAIVRARGQQKIAELERRERIAAIERGIDPAKLPPPISAGGYESGSEWGSQLRRAHGLMIGGFVTVAVGLGMMILMRGVEPGHDHWVIGFLPLFVGMALLLSSRIIWPKDEK